MWVERWSPTGWISTKFFESEVLGKERKKGRKQEIEQQYYLRIQKFREISAFFLATRPTFIGIMKNRSTWMILAGVWNKKSWLHQMQNSKMRRHFLKKFLIRYINITSVVLPYHIPHLILIDRMGRYYKAIEYYVTNTCLLYCHNDHIWSEILLRQIIHSYPA